MQGITRERHVGWQKRSTNIGTTHVPYIMEMLHGQLKISMQLLGNNTGATTSGGLLEGLGGSKNGLRQF